MVYYKNKLYELITSIRDFAYIQANNENLIVGIKNIDTGDEKEVRIGELISYSKDRNLRALGLIQ